MGKRTRYILATLLMLSVSTIFAETIVANTTQKEKKSARELIESGKRVSNHRILKSDDPELIFSVAMNYYEASKWKRAADLFDGCQAYYIGSMREDTIAFYSARSRFKNRDYSTATPQLDEFRRKFGRSAFIEDAEAMLAMCHYYLAPGPTRDQTISAEAIVSFSEFIQRYPNSKRVEAFNNLIEELSGRMKEKTFLNAYTYFKIQRYKSAVVAFRNALKLYPDTPYREKILYYIAVSSYRLAHNSVASKQAERYLKLLDAYYSFIEEFPKSKHCKELERYAKEAKNFMDKNNVEK